MEREKKLAELIGDHDSNCLDTNPSVEPRGNEGREQDSKAAWRHVPGEMWQSNTPQLHGRKIPKVKFYM